MNYLFFEFIPTSLDKLIEILSDREYDKHVVVVDNIFVEACDNFLKKNNILNIEKFIYNKYQTEKNDLLQYLKKVTEVNRDAMNFFVVFSECTLLESVAIEFVKQPYAKSCFICAEDNKKSIFNVDESEFIRVVIDNFNFTSNNEDCLSSMEKIDLHLVGKFEFLQKFMKK